MLKHVVLEFSGPLKNKTKTHIHIGKNLEKKIVESIVRLHPSRVVILFDSKLKSQSVSLSKKLNRHFQTTQISIKATEKAKDLRSLNPIFSHLIKASLNRDSLLVAIGGGVVGDLTGFVASTYQRGIRWIGIPTTLLAQVDSSIGGKTGVNHPLGKNLIGSFHQPSLVFCDTAFLSSLKTRDRISGAAEISKIAISLDPKLFLFLEKNIEKVIALENTPLVYSVERALKKKSEIVSKDEFELTGQRRILNFGHTLGHALEAATSYRDFRHGEAVIWGMRLAVALSLERGHLSQKTTHRIETFLKRLSVPKWPRRVTVKKILPFVKRDKKANQFGVPYVLLADLGKTVLDYSVTQENVMAAFRRVNA